MTDMKRLNMILGITAAVILVASCAAFGYSLVPKGDTSMVVVNDIEYSWDDLFSDFETVTFVADEAEYEGVLLSSIVLDAGVVDAETRGYRIVGSDGYQKDVTWEDMSNGYLVMEDNVSIFPELTHSYWVKGVVGVEVI